MLPGGLAYAFPQRHHPDNFLTRLRCRTHFCLCRPQSEPPRLVSNKSMCCSLWLQPLDVDLFVLLHPAQSESMQATTSSDSFWYLYQFTTLGYRTRYIPSLTTLLSFFSLLLFWQIRCPSCLVPRNLPLMQSSCILSLRLHSTCRNCCRCQSCLQLPIQSAHFQILPLLLFCFSSCFFRGWC